MKPRTFLSWLGLMVTLLFPLVALLFLAAFIGYFNFFSSGDTVMPDLPQPSQLTDDEIPRADQLIQESHDLLYKKEYGRLEQAGERAATADWMLSSGTQPLDDYYQGVDYIPDGGAAEYHRQLVLINSWCLEYPDSAYSNVAMAHLLYNDGQNGEQDKSDSLWSTAMDYLNKVPENKRDCNWYYTRVVLLQSTADEGEWTRVGEEGLRRYPDATDIAQAVIFHMEPRWGGTESSGAAFATKVANAHGGDDGDIFYARVACYVFENNYEQDLCSKRGFVWSRVKHGMELICKRFPKSSLAVNRFASLAGGANEREIANYLFNYLGPHINADKQVWYSSDYLNNVQEWAKGNTSFPQFYDN